MNTIRRSFDSDFKMSLVLEVLQGRRVTDVAKEHDIHYSLLSKWKSDFLNAAQTAFIPNNQIQSEKEAQLADLKEQNDHMKRIIGEQKVQLEILKKKPWLD